MQNRLKNIGMWLSIIATIATTYIAYTEAQTTNIKIGIISGCLMAIAGIISNPKEGIGYFDK